MTYQGLPLTEQDDWGPVTRSTPAHVWLTVALGLAGAVTAPVTLTVAQFLGAFMIGGFLGAFVLMLARSAMGTADSPEALVAALHMAAVGAVAAVALTVLTVTLGVRGWAIAAAVVGLAVLVRRLFAPVAEVAPDLGWDDRVNERW